VERAAAEPLQKQMAEPRKRNAKGQFLKGHKEGHRFKSGDEWDGNAGGRPKGVSITAEMNELLAADPDKILKIKPATGAALLARGIFTRATQKSDLLAQETWNRVDGKLVGKTENQHVVVNTEATPEEAAQIFLAMKAANATARAQRAQENEEA
jgi:hypothetical protein